MRKYETQNVVKAYGKKNYHQIFGIPVRIEKHGASNQPQLSKHKTMKSIYDKVSY